MPVIGTWGVAGLIKKKFPAQGVAEKTTGSERASGEWTDEDFGAQGASPSLFFYTKKIYFYTKIFRAFFL